MESVLSSEILNKKTTEYRRNHLNRIKPDPVKSQSNSYKNRQLSREVAGKDKRSDQRRFSSARFVVNTSFDTENQRLNPDFNTDGSL